MRKILSYILSFALVAGVSSCQRSDDDDPNAEGTITLQLATADNTIPGTSVSRAATNPIYSVEIFGQGQTQALISYPDHTQMPASIKLKVGNYNVVATSGESYKTPAFDSPTFIGEQSVNVTANNASNIDITASLNNVVFTLSHDDKINANFTKADLLIYQTKGDGNPLFTITKAEQNKLAYLPFYESYYWVLSLTNTQGETFKLDGDLTNVVVRNRFDFKFKISDNVTPDSEGLRDFILTIDKDLEEYTTDVEITPTEAAAPQITVEDNAFDPSQTISVNEKKRGIYARYNLTIPAGVQEFWFFHDIEQLRAAGIPEAIKISDMTGNIQTSLREQGVVISTTAIGATSAFIDISALCNTLPLGSYQASFSVSDVVRQYVRQTIDIAVLPDQDHMIDNAVPWAAFATVNAQWFTLEQPANLTVEYQENGTDTWTKAPVENATYNVDTKKYSVKIYGLKPSTTYNYRSYSDTKEGEVVKSFTTEAAVVLPNLDFEEWVTANAGSGLTGAKDVWFLGSERNFWATGNQGTKLSASKVGKNITTPEETVVVKGKAVRMESVGGVYIAGHAAGNLFTGEFSISGLPTNTGAMRKSVKFGRPYTSRPIGLKGYYKYNSQTITVDTDKMHQDMLGKPDMCQIYISLENWGGATSRPDNPNVIGYGEFVSSTEGSVMSDYAEFSFKIDYKDVTTRPTHIVMVASSSIYGGDFCGGVGSELYLDEFEMIWDPSMLP